MRLLVEARGELNQKTGETSEEATFRDASRIGQFLVAGGAHDSHGLAELLSCFDQSATVRRFNAKPTQLVNDPSREAT
jgi:hypothetical protein